MNERMSDLLDRASDDDGAPVGFSGESVARRARTRQHRRHGTVAIGLTAAGVAGILVATQVVGRSGPETQGPATTGPSTTAPQTASPSPTVHLTPQQQAITDLCARQHLPAPVIHMITGQDGQDGMHQPQKGAKMQDTSSQGPLATILKSWTLDAYAQDDLGTTATFVNPAHTRWASCNVAAGGTEDADGLWTAPLQSGPVPRSWYGPNGFRHQGNTVGWSQVCAPGEGKVCAHELFTGTLARYAGVASARVDAPDGTVLKPVFGHYTYVFRHVEQRVDRDRPANDMQTMHSMPVTLLDAHGHTIIRYDYFPAEILPGNCPPTGGC